MTTFIDGPARGKTLMLKRSPRFLRVVRCKHGHAWDALDRLEDDPKPHEEIVVYHRLGEKAGMVHVNMGRRGSGFFSMAKYFLWKTQPDDATMRDRTAWREWCANQFDKEQADAR